MRQTNLGPANGYFAVTRKFNVEAIVGHEPSNAWYGAANILRPVWQTLTVRRIDLIANTHGGLFLVRREGSRWVRYPVAMRRPEFKPFERVGARRDDFDLTCLEQITEWQFTRKTGGFRNISETPN